MLARRGMCFTIIKLLHQGNGQVNNMYYYVCMYTDTLANLKVISL